MPGVHVSIGPIPDAPQILSKRQKRERRRKLIQGRKDRRERRDMLNAELDAGFASAVERVNT